MKIFRYLVFLSILSGVFIVLYRQSEKRGFRRLWISLRAAIVIAAAAAGLIAVNGEAIESAVDNNNPVYEERLLLDQNFNSFKENDKKSILVKIGDSSPSVPTSPGLRRRLEVDLVGLSPLPM